eukprot:14419668-Heterocapsa_arctica.AAC.1
MPRRPRVRSDFGREDAQLRCRFALHDAELAVVVVVDHDVGVPVVIASVADVEVLRWCDGHRRLAVGMLPLHVVRIELAVQAHVGVELRE